MRSDRLNQRLRSSIAIVRAIDDEGWSKGTGFHIGNNLFLTAWHYLKRHMPPPATLYYIERSGLPIHSSLIASDNEADIALLEYRGVMRRSHLLKLAQPGSFFSGMSIAALGFARASDVTPLLVRGYYDGEISEEICAGCSQYRNCHPHKKRNSPPEVCLDDQIYMGLSGSPIVSVHDGTVISMWLSSNPGKGTVWGVAAERIRQFIDMYAQVS
jgi:hypothetical protein